MSWATRVGDTVRNFVVLGIDLFTIGSEVVKQLAVAVDDFADGLKEAVEPPVVKPPEKTVQPPTD